MTLAAQLEEKLGVWATRLVEQAAEGVYFALRDNCPQVSGELMNSIQRPTQEDNAPHVAFRMFVAAEHHQEEYTERGTEPHPIEPVRARALRFPAGSAIIFASHVNHPGNAARPWFFPTCELEFPQQLREYDSTIPLEL